MTDTVFAAPVPAVVHLSGGRRGTTERLAGDTLDIGTDVGAAIRLVPDRDLQPDRRYATFRRRGLTYALEVVPGTDVWVNGQPTDEMVLASGDVIEIGRGGPVLRFRLYEPGSAAWKSMSEAFADCVDCARYGSRSTLGRAAVILRSLPVELATQTGRMTRTVLAVAIVALGVSTALLARRSAVLEDRITEVRAAAEVAARADSGSVTGEELARIRAELAAEVTETRGRVQALEARSGAVARVVEGASRATVLVQGAFGFVDTATGRALRYVLGPDGIPQRHDNGVPVVTRDGAGPELESQYTGTAFVATGDGLLVTNRHVARPWENDPVALALIGEGFRPVIRRFIGYLPGQSEPFDLTVIRVSEDADVALIQCSDVTGTIPHLALRTTPLRAGEEIVVLGYPMGIRALLVRTDVEFVSALEREGRQDFWSVARQLSERGYVAPLASRGIVAQAAQGVVVYDAETTHGGSGGPVLDLDGRVVAVTSGGIPQFGGSNLGVTAVAVREMLRTAR